MKNKVLYKSPNLIIREIEDNIYCVVNPYIRNGLKLLNSFQVLVLSHIDGEITVNELFQKSNISDGEGERLLTILGEKKFISETREFSDVLEQNYPKSLNLWIHTTDNCNLGCKYCYIGTKITKNNMSKSVMYRTGEKIIDIAKREEAKLITLRLAGGEPLLHFGRWKSYLLDLQEEVKRYGCGIKFTFLTNLTILTDDIIEFIKAHNCGIGVSLDGIGIFHDSSRSFVSGRGSFDVTYTNIMRLLENNIRPSIMTVVSNNNLDGLLKLTKFLIREDLNFRYSIVQGESFDYKKASVVFDDCYNYFEQEIENGYNFTRKFKLCDLKFNDIFHQTCGAGESTAAIYTDGRVYFCQQQVGTNDHTDSVLTDMDMFAAISKGKKFDPGLAEECKRCSYKFVCTGGCPLNRNSLNKSPSCEFYKDFIPKTYRLMGKERLYSIKRHIASSDEKRTACNSERYGS